jgi:hypothetical protein
MTTQAADPARDIALMALNADPLARVQMLESVILYAFDQLCYRRTSTDIDLLLARLREGAED